MKSSCLTKAVVLLVIGIMGACAIAAEIPFQHVIIDGRFPRRPHCKAAGDINDDGRLDVVVTDSEADDCHLYWSGLHNLPIADIDGDGAIDIIGANWGGSYRSFELWRNRLDPKPQHSDPSAPRRTRASGTGFQ
jgi:hypothetical protein